MRRFAVTSVRARLWMLAIFVGTAAQIGFSQTPESRPGNETSFAGLWKTTYGAMRLHADRDRVSGFYAHGGMSRIDGTVSGRKLTFEYREPSAKGNGSFELSEDGSTFSGEWAAADTRPAQPGRWTGERMTKHAGRIWLIVLEAHWEHGLGSHEYSYGEMLRAYFRRAPQVEVRHRFFHDEDDLKRFCEDLRFFAEPVVLYISTHGSSEGLNVCGRTIGARTIAESLKDSCDVRLLHFGSCSVMSGGLPAQIFQSLGAQATFPISGYRNTADWAGSAVIDFLYLSLVLEHGMPPADAVEYVRSTVSFSHEASSRPGPIAPTGLAIAAPETRPVSIEPATPTTRRR